MPIKQVDGLTNPKTFHRPAPTKRRWPKLQWRKLAALVIVGGLLSYFVGPRLNSLARQVEIYELLTNGRYLVLFQNDAEIRPSGGFIGSFAIIEAKDQTIKPLYFETNIYKLDDPFNQATKLEPPKPLKAAIGDRGWGMRDSNFAADFRQAAPTTAWFFQQEVKRLTGPKRAEIDRQLQGNYEVDGVIAINMSAFLDLLKAVGPIAIPQQNITVNSENFFPVVQQVVERDYFKDPANKVANEPKQILQQLFPLALEKMQKLPKRTQYQLAKSLLQQKKIIIYSNDSEREQTLVDAGWAGALELATDTRPEEPTDFLAIIRSSHGGNKSSLDINPVYRYSLNAKGEIATVKVDITFEHQGTGEWPSGVNHEYLRILAPKGAELIGAAQHGENVLKNIDIGEESGKTAFGFWLHTEPKSSQNISLTYQLPVATIKAKDYQLILFRQPGGNAPDLTVTYNGKQLYQARLLGDRVIKE